MRHRIYGFFLVPLFILSLGASPLVPTVELKVSDGDSLSNICKRYLDDPAQWREVARLNRLGNPDLIHPGQTLRVPARLLKGQPLEGVVTFVKGKAEFFNRESGAWKEVRLNDRVAQGSRLKTGEESTVEITLGEGDVLLVKANTDLELASSQKKGLLHRAYKLFLDVGQTVTKIQSATGEESRYDIRTPSALAMARGTEFRLAVDQGSATRCEVLEGEVGVLARERVVAVRQGEGTLVESGGTPMAPKPLLPPPALLSPAPVYKSLPLALAFSKVEGAVSQRVTLSRDEQCRDIASEAVIRTGETWKIAHLPDGAYYLRTLSIDAIGLEGTPSPALPLRVRVNPLPPYSQKPLNGGEYSDRSLPIQWLKVRDAVATRIQIAEDELFTRLRADHKENGLKYTTDPLEQGTYYFRAASIAEDGYEGGWSDVIPFKIIPPPPSPSVAKPEMSEERVQIGWRHMGDGSKYRFQMAGDDSFREILLEQVLEQPAIDLKKPEKAGSYFVRTATIDPKGNEGDFSPPQSFEIEEGFSYGILAGILSAVMLLLLL